jgi:histidinol-phosphate aminotransferase
MDVLELIRPNFVKLTPYSSARDEYSGKEGIFLDANENPFSSVTHEDYNRYPDPYQWKCKEKLAQLKGVSPENIFLGNGSDEAIDLLIKITCEPKADNILILPPTYGMYKVCADIQQVYVQEAPLTDNFEINLDTVFDSVNSATKIIWICSPNNPSGNKVDREAIVQILKAFPHKMVVIDEAYIDFSAEPSFILELNQYPNLVVIQTFSKAWGMAGLRIGAAYAHAEIIKILNKVKYPYNINILTQEKLFESLDNSNVKDAYVKEILLLRENLQEQLLQIPITEKVYPSDSNMLVVKFTKAKELFHFLLENKMIIRDRTNVILCKDCLRITIGTRAENDQLVKLISEFSIASV